MKTIITTVDALNGLLGKAIAWLVPCMVLMVGWTVFQRYVLQSGEPWEQELVRFMHAMVFLLAAAYTLRQDAHVRVDVFYQRFSERRKAWVEIVGTLLLLLPVCGAIFWFSAEFISNSWAIREGSSEYHGMPGVYLLKSCIWLFTITMAMQGIARMLRAILVLQGRALPDVVHPVEGESSI